MNVDFNLLLLYSKNLVVVAILLLAVFAYAVLLEFAILRKMNAAWFSDAFEWSALSKRVLSVLPLLGLLGTIVGLMSTFVDMSEERSALEDIVTGGIGSAMFTTQLGLLLVIPGLLLHGLLGYKLKRWQIKNAIQKTENPV